MRVRRHVARRELNVVLIAVVRSCVHEGLDGLHDRRSDPRSADAVELEARELQGHVVVTDDPPGHTFLDRQIGLVVPRLRVALAVRGRVVRHGVDHAAVRQGAQALDGGQVRVVGPRRVRLADDLLVPGVLADHGDHAPQGAVRVRGVLAVDLGEHALADGLERHRALGRQKLTRARDRHVVPRPSPRRRARHRVLLPHDLAREPVGLHRLRAVPLHVHQRTRHGDHGATRGERVGLVPWAQGALRDPAGVVGDPVAPLEGRGAVDAAARRGCAHRDRRRTQRQPCSVVHEAS